MGRPEQLARRVSADYVRHPALQGYRLRAYHMGEASGLRGTDIEVAYARWLKRWCHKPESLCWRDWREGHEFGTLRRSWE